MGSHLKESSWYICSINPEKVSLDCQMTAIPKRSIEFLPFLIAIAVCIFFNSSCGLAPVSEQNENSFVRYSVKEANLNLGDSEKYEFSESKIVTDQNSRVLAHYDKINRVTEERLGRFFRISENGGEIFGDEYKISDLITTEEELDRYDFQFVKEWWSRY